MSVHQSTVGLNRVKKDLKNVYKKSFPADVKWKSATPFTSDDVFWVTNDKNKVVSLCMLHNEPPKPFYSSGYYLYNLCTLPDERKKGYATKLIEHIKEKYPVIHCHHSSTDADGHKWFYNRGFVAENLERGTLREYTYPSSAAAPEFQNIDYETRVETLLKKPSNLYDRRSNLFYLN